MALSESSATCFNRKDLLAAGIQTDALFELSLPHSKQPSLLLAEITQSYLNCYYLQFGKFQLTFEFESLSTGATTRKLPPRELPL
jgi:hypothetical protein